MRKLNGKLIFSPSDLTTFWESPFASWMDRFALEVPDNELKKDEADELLKLVRQKGELHEAQILHEYEEAGLRIAKIDRDKGADPFEQTLEALKSGYDVIYQAALRQDRLQGYSDFLVKAHGSSALGDFHYQVWDTKVAGKVKPYFIIQLCAYAQMLQSSQGLLSPEIGVILGNNERRAFRTAAYFFYYENVKQTFLKFHDEWNVDLPPEPDLYRSHGDWGDHAKALLEKNDSLLQVAGISRGQAKHLRAAGVTTMSELATHNDRVPKISPKVLDGLRHQARLQVQSKGKERPAFEMIQAATLDAGFGLKALPKVSKLDVYFDIEGYPLASGGLEYLWGSSYFEGDGLKFKDFWAHTKEQEKKALEDFIDWVSARYKEDQTMHVYHYAPYETNAIKRLSSAFGTRENEVDVLLRAGVFVDLYRLVKHSVRIGEPSYSIKNIEKLYRGARSGDVKAGGESVAVYHAWTEAPDGATWETSKLLKSIRDYNQDDCESTVELAAWLRSLQKEAGIEASGGRHQDTAEEEKVDVGEEVHDLVESVKADDRPEAHLLAALIEFHRREEKPGWWQYFDRLSRLAEELIDDADCIAFARRTSRPPEAIKQSQLIEYEFDPAQETKLTGEDKVTIHPEGTFHFDLYSVELDLGRLCVKLGKAKAKELPIEMSLVSKPNPNNGNLNKAIQRFCREWLDDKSKAGAVLNLLRREPPPFKSQRTGELIDQNEDLLSQVISVASDLDHGTLCIQGPPGAGKTYVGCRMIAALVKEGCRVGVVSNSHKAINNLLARAAEVMKEQCPEFELLKLGRGDEPEFEGLSNVDQRKNSNSLELEDHIKVVGGTAWAFCGENMLDQFDYLFVDEAGQVSLAKLVAIAGCTRNIVLLGDQMQLNQPTQGSHPGESGQSCLEYYLQDQATIAPEVGIFLPISRRMHPDVCDFISEAIYEGRLSSHPSAKERVVKVSGKCDFVKAESGLLFIPVEHEDNSQSSDEEIEMIKVLVKELLGREKTGLDGAVCGKVTIDDILFVTPYNMQVRRLQEALGADAKVGTVDKFQGQEAAIVIVSLCASDLESGRGVGFVLNKNRLNVAISRAQSLAIVVGNPGLASARVGGVGDMELVNLFCRIRGGRE